MRAVPASSVGLDRLVETWNAAYAGYFVPMSWDLAQLRRHLEVGSVDLDRSLVWFDGAAPVALSLLGVREDAPAAAGSAHSTEDLAASSHAGSAPTQSSAHNPPPQTQSSAHNPPLGPRAESEHSTEGSSVQNLRAPESSVQNLRAPESSVQNLRGWIGGFGIVEAHRGRGLSTPLMREQLEVARTSGVERVQLEVLTQNWAARSYERAGFVTTRRLEVLQGTLAVPERSLAAGPAVSWVGAEDVPDLTAQLARLHAAFPAAWTRDPSAILQMIDGLRCLVVGSPEAPDAVALVREHDGAVQVVDAVAEGAFASQALTAELASAYAGGGCRLVNEPEGSPLVPALAAAGVVEVLAQHEMHWTA